MAEQTPKSLPDESANRTRSCVKLHLTFGCWSLFLFVILGVVLESLHAFKVGWYLDVGNDARRLSWRLAHAHGTFLALVNIVFALVLSLLPEWSTGSRSLASRCLLASVVLVPGGFFLGGIWIYGGDPGLGVFLVPPGALLVCLAVLLTGLAIRKHAPGGK